MNPDAFDNLNNLRLTLERGAQAKNQKGPSKPTRRKLKGDFVIVPVPWLYEACDVLSSSRGLFVALQIYRLWHMRKPGTDYVVASNQKLGVLKDVKRRAIASLREGGLIEVLPGAENRSPKVRVIER
jgi:hypothetical protein